MKNNTSTTLGHPMQAQGCAALRGHTFSSAAGSDKMQAVDGRLAMFVYDADGVLQGFLLDRGQEVRFSATPENVRAVRQIATMNSQIRVQGELRRDEAGEEYVQASSIMNLDSQRAASLPTPTCQGKSGMLPAGPPRMAASLNRVEGVTGDAQRECCPGPGAGHRQPLRPGVYFQQLLQREDGNGAEAARYEAVRSIGLAYDNLHRIQAILAYLHIMKHRVPGISQFLDEAKHTYEQALSRFTSGDCASAKEFAEASASLSRVVEIVMARTLRADASMPSLVPPPPQHLRSVAEPKHVEEDLAQAEAVLSRIHWVLENGTLPCEDRAQVRKITAWGDAFYKQAQHKYREAVLEDAAEFAQAALAGAYSAEHVCRKWYASHAVNS